MGDTSIARNCGLDSSRFVAVSEMYDVLIVGAGPGGATAAYFLGEAGQRVLVLERETLPRYKACGGGLSAHMLEKQFPFSFDPVIETRVKSIAYALGGQAITIPLTDPSMRMVNRLALTTLLAATIVALGLMQGETHDVQRPCMRQTHPSRQGPYRH